jgi:mannan endo-1,4-beta-mannosidase
LRPRLFVAGPCGRPRLKGLLPLALLPLLMAAVAWAGVTPVLSVEGQTLRWTGNSPGARYVLERKPGPFFLEVTGNSYVPAPEPGTTDYFRVRPYSSPNLWSNEVSITWEKASSPFLGKVGTSIALNGNPVRQLGYNGPWAGPACAGAGISWLEATLPKIVVNSRANILRLGMFQTYLNGKLSFANSRREIEWAKKYGLRIVPMLADNFGQCENAGTENPPHRKFLSWYQTGYTEPEGLHNKTGSSQPLSYKQYAEAFAKHYANEPTIAWYQLINEPDGLSSSGSCSETAAKTALRGFADKLTEAIKAIDHHHMVDLGAPQSCGVSGSDYTYVVAGKADLCDAYHDYTNGTEAIQSWQRARLEQCIGVDKKPAFVGEAGLCAYVNSAGTCSAPTTAATLLNRANDFKAKLKAALSLGISGYVIWSAGPECSGTGSSTQFVVGANNGTASYNCLVSEIDPTEPMLARFAAP